MTSNARERLRDEDGTVTEEVPADRDHGRTDGASEAGTPSLRDDDTRGDTAVGYDDDLDGARDGEPDRASRRSGRVTIPLVPTLAVLLVLLLAGLGYLWFTRPAPSSVRTADYVQVLQAARSEVVDLTSFDYQTLDDDIAQAKKIAVGDLRDQSVKQLNASRKQLTDQQAVVSTQVVGGAVTRADDTHGTVLLVIQSTQHTKASAQSQVVRYRIEVQLQKTGGRWLLSGISGR